MGNVSMVSVKGIGCYEENSPCFIFVIDLSRHIVKDNDSVQALLDKGNNKRFGQGSEEWLNVCVFGNAYQRNPSLHHVTKA